jgi:hypothetical protein
VCVCACVYVCVRVVCDAVENTGAFAWESLGECIFSGNPSTASGLIGLLL